MTQKSQTKVKINNQTPDLNILEQEIADIFPPQVFDYPYILSPETHKDIKLNSPLSAKQIEVLSRYNSFADSFFTEIGVEIDHSEVDLFEKFLELSRNIYLVRFVEARKLFAQYSLFIIPTLAGLQIAKDFGESTESPVSMEISIPGSLLINDDGSFDFEGTVELEKKTNTIKSTFSSFSNFLDLANKSIADLTNITTRGFLISMNEKALLEIMQIALQNLIIEVNKLSYDYIDRGYSPREAYENVRKMLMETTPKTGTILPEVLKSSQKPTEDLIIENIKLHIEIDQNVQEDLFTEIMELIVHYSSEGLLVSENMYKLRFLHYADLPADYQNYHHVIEVFLMDDFGDTLLNPSEAYDIDFSRNFKEILFTLVTNGMENPDLPIEDYLYRV